jgi:hypothetical protein
MKRLIDSKGIVNFKNWVKQHDPKKKWDWDDPVNLRNQLIEVIRESGDIDIRTIFEVLFAYANPGLTIKQNEEFLKEGY